MAPVTGFEELFPLPSIKDCSFQESSRITLQSTDASCLQRFFKRLNKMRMRGNLCDAILATQDGASFRVHKSIMSSSSQYFRTLFTTALTDRGDGEPKVFYCIPNLSSEIMETFVKIAYGGVLEVTEENVAPLLIAADQFQFEQIEDECRRFMLERLAPENCVGIWRFGKEYQMPRIEREAKRYILCNFLQVLASSEEFIQLEAADVSEVLRSDNLNVPSEIFVWIAIKKWCQFRYQDRRGSIPTLVLGCLRLALLTSGDLQRVASDPRVFPTDQCKKRIRMVKILKGGVTPGEGVGDVAPLFTPRHPFDLLFAVGGCGDREVIPFVEVYDNRANMWETVSAKDQPGAIVNHQVACLGQSLYVLGGTKHRDVVNTCWKFDPQSLRFERVPPMLKRRRFHCAVVLSGRIYVMGGEDENTRFDSVEYYDPAQNLWTFVSPMHGRRCEFGAAPLRDRIFVAGGRAGAGAAAPLPDVECYFAEFDQWFPLPPLARPRRALACAATEEAVYALGGRDDQDRPLATVEKYCVRDRQWVPARPMAVARSNLAAAVVEKKIYAVGGQTSPSSATSAVEIFDPAKHQWWTIAPMAFPRYGLACCTLSGLMDVTPFIKDDRTRCLLEGGSEPEHSGEGPTSSASIIDVTSSGRILRES